MAKKTPRKSQPSVELPENQQDILTTVQNTVSTIDDIADDAKAAGMRQTAQLLVRTAKAFQRHVEQIPRKIAAAQKKAASRSEKRRRTVEQRAERLRKQLAKLEAEVQS